MALKIIRAQMKQRRDTAANWAANNPVLLEGELGLVLDHPNSYKVGDGSTPWNSLPLRGFDGNIVQELGDSSTSVISQAGISGLIAEQNAKLAQLSQELQTIIDNGLTFVVKPHIDKVVMTETIATLEPDKFYLFGEVSALNITLAPVEEGYASQYIFQFTSPLESPTTLTMPVTIIWSDIPTIKGGMTYQVSVVEGLAMITGWTTAIEE